MELAGFRTRLSLPQTPARVVRQTVLLADPAAALDAVRIASEDGLSQRFDVDAVRTTP